MFKTHPKLRNLFIFQRRFNVSHEFLESSGPLCCVGDPKGRWLCRGRCTGLSLGDQGSCSRRGVGRKMSMSAPVRLRQRMLDSLEHGVKCTRHLSLCLTPTWKRKTEEKEKREKRRTRKEEKRGERRNKGRKKESAVDKNWG